MDGIRLNDNDSLEAYGVDKQKLVEEITRAYAHQIYIDGFFNGDPHPGNYMHFGKVSVIFSLVFLAH
jgi:aarF domain-containing kinase